MNDSKVTEWGTLSDKSAIRLHFGKKAQQLKERYPDRFIGSRFVITRKPIEEGQNIVEDDPSSYRVKSRWCLQGHLDPDLDDKAMSGLLQSPTLSQPSRVLIMQILSSFGWTIQLGDIKGAFLEAGPLPERYRPLFARQPPGGIPGVPPDAVIEVIGNVYGQNDAPSAWFRTFDEEATKIGWSRSKFDPCLYTLRDDSNRLCGILGVHVDDSVVGGSGAKFEQAVAALKARFPYRKWRLGEGEFCGSYYTQDAKTKEIVMSQKAFAEKLRPAAIARTADPDQLLDEKQMKMLRGINGSLNWLASQTRPDLSVQTSLSQQCFPKPKIKDLRTVNNAIRRGKLHKDLSIVFKSIKPENLTLCCHSDAAWANVGVHTQAGFILGFCDKALHDGHVSPWTPAIWKSYKLPRAVSSTFRGEAQALSTASGSIEWLSLLLSETLDGHFPVIESRKVLSRRSPIFATDCKSLFDHLISPSAPTSIEDRRTSIDVVIIRESLKATNGTVRWLPTDRMIADGLTKDKADPVDLLRSAVRHGQYQISPEKLVLEQQAEERERRKKSRLNEVERPPDKFDEAIGETCWVERVNAWVIRGLNLRCIARFCNEQIRTS